MIKNMFMFRMALREVDCTEFYENSQLFYGWMHELIIYLFQSDRLASQFVRHAAHHCVAIEGNGPISSNLC